MANDLAFPQAKSITMENLETIQTSLMRCVDEGMIDLEDTYYNEILGLIDEANLVDTWEELMEVVTRAKTLENDVAAWLAMHGRTTVSLPWPKRTYQP